VTHDTHLARKASDNIVFLQEREGDRVFLLEKNLKIDRSISPQFFECRTSLIPELDVICEPSRALRLIQRSQLCREWVSGTYSFSHRDRFRSALDRSRGAQRNFFDRLWVLAAGCCFSWADGPGDQ